jgi:hypothetical protein
MSNIIVPENYFTPREYQKEVLAALQSGIKRIILVWSRQMGKDTTSFCAMVMMAMQNPGNYYYIFPTREQAKKAVWEKIDHRGSKLLNVIPEELLLRKSDQEMMIRIKAIGGESTIRMIGIDQTPDSVRGITPAGIVFSEYAYQNPEGHAIVSPAVEQNPNCWVIYNSTPQGKNHFYKLHEATKNDPEWFNSIRQVRFPGKPNYINNVIGLKQLEKIQRSLGYSDEIMDQEYGCSWDIGMSGAIYADCIVQAEIEGRVGTYTPDHQKWVDTFWDLGFNDPTSVWFRQIHGNKEVFMDLWEESAKDVPSVVEVLVSKGYKFRNHYLPHDAANNNPGMPYTYRELLEACLRQSPLRHPGNVVVCDKFPIQDGINGVRSRFPNLCFDEARTKEGLEKLGAYHRRYDTKRGVFLKEPVHDSASHAADALRTLISAEEFGDDSYDPHTPLRIISDYDGFGD